MALPNTQVVFLSDAKSVVKRIHKLPHLLNALQDLMCNKMVLQRIPSHCGIQGNEEADKLAKQGAEKPETNSVSLPEINTMIKSIYRTPCSSHNYHQ
jgi:ribonuclease HI